MSAVSPFPNNQYWKVLETAETFIAGSYLVTDYNLQLKHIVMTMYKEDDGSNSYATTELVCKLWHDSAMTQLYATSDTFYLSSLTPVADSWRGNIRFDFDEQFLNKNQTYYVSITPTNYTRDGNDVYLAFAFDWPLPINTNASAPQYGMAMEFYGLKRVTY